MPDQPTYRPADPADLPACFRLFRHALFAHLHRTGLVTAEQAAAPSIEPAWKRQSDWMTHLWNSAAENRVATDARGNIIGWALSVERGGHLELAFFFVAPDQVSRGIGARLLDQAFTSRPEAHKTIMATLDPAALSLYLRSGVTHVTTSCDILIIGRPAQQETDLDLRPLQPDDLPDVIALERHLLGLSRSEDLRFLMRTRPGWIARREGTPVGYAFGAAPPPEGASDVPPGCGPMGALSDSDLPPLLDHVLANVAEGSELFLTVPMASRKALAHLLQRGGRIDPFYLAVLSSSPDLRLDRYVHTSPSFLI